MYEAEEEGVHQRPGEESCGEGERGRTNLPGRGPCPGEHPQKEGAISAGILRDLGR